MEPDVIFNCSYAANCLMGENPNEIDLYFRNGRALVTIRIPLEQAEHLVKDLNSEVEELKEYNELLNIQ